MNARDNLLSLYRRQGYDSAPVGFHLCPSLEDAFKQRHGADADYMEYFGMPYRIIYDPGFAWNFDAKWRVSGREDINWHKFYPEGFERDVQFDLWGTAHEKGSEACVHMTRMHHPMKNFDSLQQMQEYPWPDFESTDFSYLHDEVKAIHDRDLAVFVWAECTIWETSWYLRSMDALFMDMALEDEKATFLLDTITEKACYRAEKFAEAGVDILGLGDDIGMQDTAMMSNEMYRTWLQPRLAKVISAAKKGNPDILISYHSCGNATPLLPELIEAGIDILNPVQPESMDFESVYAEHGDKISFNGTIGTQQLMPFGTAQEVADQVKRNLDMAGENGGLFCCPTHMLEPEVPWENIESYVSACKEYK